MAGIVSVVPVEIKVPAGGWTSREYAIMRTEPTFEVLDKDKPEPLWALEADVLRFDTDDDYTGVVLRHSEHLNLCGYLVLNDVHHPWWMKGYDDISAEVHGGLTYADTGIPRLRAPDGISGWAIGFDCNHAGDYAPGMDWGRGTLGAGAVYRDVEYTYQQLWRLLRQARKAHPTYIPLRERLGTP